MSLGNYDCEPIGANVDSFTERRAKWVHHGLLGLVIILALVFIVECVRPARFFHRGGDPRQQIMQAAAADRQEFSGETMVHFRYDWTTDMGSSSDGKQFWSIPVAEINPSGKVAARRLHFVSHDASLTDDIWIEPSSGRFVRVIQRSGIPYYAVSFDGKNLCSYDSSCQPEVQREMLASGIRMIDKLPELFSMTAGVPLPLDGPNPPCVEFIKAEDDLIWGRVRVFQVGASDDSGKSSEIYTIKISIREGRLVEIAGQQGGQTLYYLHRPFPNKPAITRPQWDLGDLRII